MSPLVWDLAHVGHYEELWLVRALTGEGPLLSAELDDLYDALRHPRAERPSLPLLGPAEALRYLGRVRRRTLEVLHTVDPRTAGPERARLLDRGFIYFLVVQHEHQHVETMLATLQLMRGEGYRRHLPASAVRPWARSVAPPVDEEIFVEGGRYVVGVKCDPRAYDNESCAHEVVLRPFFLDATPVTNGAYLRFVEAGGYHDRRLWTEEGWAWRVAEEVEHPLFWQRGPDGRFVRRRFGLVEPLGADEPVQHVSWYEADAYARWAGRRLPTEAEWEVAASYDGAGRKRRYPWGDAPPSRRRANLGGRSFGPAPVGAHPAGRSAAGAFGLIGDVWEWTASDFRPYPGFEACPYREYSEIFFGSSYKVLRGGSWATHSLVARATFRNWDFPVRRQIFAGFRTARDAP